MAMIDESGHWRDIHPPKKKFEDMTMSEQMIQLRSEAVEDHKGYIVADYNDEQFDPQMEGFIRTLNRGGSAPGNMTAVMSGNLTGKSIMGAEAARTLKMLSLTTRTNRDNGKIDPDYLYELINQLKTQLDREKPNGKKVNRIFNKLRIEIADNVIFFKGIREDSDELAEINTKLRQRNKTHVTEKNKLGSRNDLYKKEVARLQIDNAELARKLACFEEDGEVAKIRSKLVNVIRKQA